MQYIPYSMYKNNVQTTFMILLNTITFHKTITDSLDMVLH